MKKFTVFLTFLFAALVAFAALFADVFAVACYRHEATSAAADSRLTLLVLLLAAGLTVCAVQTLRGSLWFARGRM